MKAEQAIWLGECMEEFDHIKIDWRLIKKYCDDWERDNEVD